MVHFTPLDDDEDQNLDHAGSGEATTLLSSSNHHNNYSSTTTTTTTISTATVATATATTTVVMTCGALVRQLPNDSLVHIFTYLRDLESIVHVSLVCRNWYNLTELNMIWKRFFDDALFGHNRVIPRYVLLELPQDDVVKKLLWMTDDADDDYSDDYSDDNDESEESEESENGNTYMNQELSARLSNVAKSSFTA